MSVRLLSLVAVIPWLAGCGDSADQPSAPAPSERAAQSAAAPEQESTELEEYLRESPVSETAAAPEPSAERAVSAGGGGGTSLRAWTDTAGNALATAEFIDLMDGEVWLQTDSGEGVKFPLTSLSRADQDYVAGLVPQAPAESEETVTLAATDPPRPAETGLVQPEPAGREYGVTGRRRVVVPFDFVSRFDQGRYGRMVGDQIWKKLEREGGVIIPDSMHDIRDLCKANNRSITPDTPLAEVAEVVRRDFDADVGIWGSIERAPGHEWDVYDLAIKCVDFTAGPEPKVVYEKKGVRTKVVSEIPHVYVKELLDKLYDRQPTGPPPVDWLAEENWKNNPSLVEGGDFQKGLGGVPIGWESAGGQHREPLGGLVSWVSENENPSNKIVRFTFDKGVGDGYGVMYYSKPFVVEEGAKYRFQCRWRSNGPNVKVFIKCYDRMTSQYTVAGEPRRSPGDSAGQYVPDGSQLRECYRSQQNLYGPKNTWNVQTQDFTPKHTKYVPRWGKVMLYAYLGAGVVEFDDVVLKQIVPTSPGESNKSLRHSMESKVTIEEMRENERRGAEGRERLQQGREKEE
ncbi:MAG: SHD1 domain-containing protein [Planctomycetota bacterium]|jgi:hypothetical protein